MKATNSNERFALVQNLTVVLCPAIALFDLSAHAVTNELVGSAESHSIERFDNNGNWIKTFASAGPYYTVGFAASPVTGGVFVSTFTATILRYANRGASFGPNGSYWSTFNMSSLVGANPPQAAEVGFLAVDRTGNLYLPEWHNVAARYRGQPPDFCTYYSCQDADTRSDIVYKIDPASGAVTNFISNHLWGPYQMIFVPS